MNTYDTTAKYYHALYRLRSDELRFYRSLCRKGDRILELGCGTGRLSLELARVTRGTTLDCVDPSAAMLHEFRKKVASMERAYTHTRAITLFEESMETFRSMATYDAIFFSGQSIHCLPAHKIRAQLLRSAALCKPSGVVVVPFFRSMLPEGSFEKFQGSCAYRDGFLISSNHYQSDDGDVVRYTQTFQVFDRNGWVVAEDSDEFCVASVDHRFATSVHEGTPLKLLGCYANYGKSEATADSQDFINVYRVET